MKLYQYRHTFEENSDMTLALHAAKDQGVFVLQEGIREIIFVSLGKDIKFYLNAIRAYASKPDHVEYQGCKDFTGFTFYAEYDSKQEKNKDVAHSPQRSLQTLQYHNGNVVATEGDWQWNGAKFVKSAFCGVYPRPNSPICYDETSRDFLEERCKRISLQQALEIHPQLFLDARFFEEEKVADVTYSLLVSNVGWVIRDDVDKGKVKALYDDYVQRGTYEQVSMWSSDDPDPIEIHDNSEGE